MKVALVATLLIAACGGGTAKNVAGHSPTAGASAAATAAASPTAAATQTPPTPTQSYGVLVSGAGSTSYTVSIVDTQGKVVASAQATTPVQPTCGTTAAAVLPPPVSTSDSRLYFLDGAGSVHYLTPDGATGTATSVPAGTATRRSMFAVSPDDRRIAVVVEDFTSTGATARLYVEDLGGGNRTTTFSQTGSTGLWPTGWHGTNNLVVAKVPACTQGGGPSCCSPTELHVIDPVSFSRRFTIGGPTCQPVSWSPSGVICESTSKVSVLSWTVQTIRTLPLQGSVGAYLSPSGDNIAFVDPGGTILQVGTTAMPGVLSCSWIDDTHVLAGGDVQHQARVGDTSNGAVMPVAAQGVCGGRIPGGL